MPATVRAIAALTMLLFANELVALPCWTACHQNAAVHVSGTSGEASAEHACHEAPVREDVAQIAGLPSLCTHQHDVPDSPRASASSDRDHQTAVIPAFVLLASYEVVMHIGATMSPPPRDSISNASLSLRI